MEMKIFGFGLVAFGVILLVLIAILSTRTYQNNKFPTEDSRD